MRNGMILLILVLAVVAIGYFLNRARRGRLTGEAPATVVRTTLRPTGNQDNGRTQTDVVFRFDAGGSMHDVVYTAAGNRVEAYPVGTPGRVRYNPDQPAEADVIPPG